MGFARDTLERMRPAFRRRGVPIALGVLLVIAGFLLVRGILARRVLWERSGEAPAETAAVTRPVNLYFSSMSDDRFVAERREAPVTADLTQTLRAVVELLIAGPVDSLAPTLPADTVVRDLYLGVDGVAYVNFTASLVNRHPGGSSAEYATLGSLVRTMTVNFPEVKAVQILIDGRPRETLAGHYGIRDALRPEDFLP